MRFIPVLLSVLLCTTSALSQQPEKSLGKDAAMLDNDVWDFLNANSVLMWLSNNGAMSHNLLTARAGFEWPAGSGKHLIFTEGLVIGGRVQGEIRVGGSTYSHGWQAGPILSDGSASDPSDPRHRLFKVRQMDADEFAQLELVHQQRLRADFIEWPVDLGAPFHDANSDGIYTPDFDAWLQGDRNTDTPEFQGKEMFWYVSNDLDHRRTQNLYGTQPIGLELQMLAWSSPGAGVIDRTVYVSYTLIHKSGEDLTDAYIGRWVDPVIGYEHDDFVGIDTTLGLMYAYNGSSSDAVYGAQPPALGIAWLQSPVVTSPGDLARYGDGWREGYRNLPVSSFAFYINFDPTYRNPTLREPRGSVELYNSLRSQLDNGFPYVDPTTGGIVHHTLAGDPLSGSGWIDGLSRPPGDRRMLSSCGPFTLAVGDTQQVVLATTVGLGQHPLLALKDLQRSACLLKREYTDGIPMLVLQDALHDVSWPSRDEFTLSVSATHMPQRETIALLRDRKGTEVLRFPLYDDGQHGDGASDDGRYSADFTHAALPTGADLFIAVLDNGDILEEVPIAQMLPLVGEVHTDDFEVLSDHMDFNLEACPGENIVYAFSIENQSVSELGPWNCIAVQLIEEGTAVHLEQRIPAGETFRFDGLEHGLESTLTITVPESAQPGSILKVPIILIAGQYCMWTDTLDVAVHEAEHPMYSGLLEHTEGPATGTLAYTVADPRALNGHVYRVTVEGEDHLERFLTVENVTEGRLLHSGLAIPDEYGHHSPTIGGFRLRKGSVVNEAAVDENGDPVLTAPPLIWYFENEDRAWFSAYDNNIKYGFDFPGSSLGIFDLYPVMLVFDRTCTDKAYAYLWGVLWDDSYQGYVASPVRAFDMRDDQNPRQINLAFNERKNTTAHDNRWFPTERADDREMLLILDDAYDVVPDTAYDMPIFRKGTEMPILFGIWPVLEPDNQIFEDGDAFWLKPRVPVSKRDVFILDASTISGMRSQQPMPEVIALYPNYPNPFNPATTITYRIDRTGHVELSLNDALGRKLRTLVAEEKTAGTHVYHLALEDAPSGVYYYRLSAGGRTLTRRMLLLR